MTMIMIMTMMISKKETDLIDDIPVSEYIKDPDERIRAAQTNNRRSSVLDYRRREYGRYCTPLTSCSAWRSQKPHCSVEQPPSSVATYHFHPARPPPPMPYQWRRTWRIMWRRKRRVERRRTWSTPPYRHLHLRHRRHSNSNRQNRLHLTFAIRLQMKYWKSTPRSRLQWKTIRGYKKLLHSQLLN